MHIAELEGVVDDEKIAAETRQRTLDGGRVASSALRGRNLAVGVALEPHARKSCLIERVIDNLAEVIRMRAGQDIRVGHRNDPLKRMVTEEPSGEGDRCTDGLQIAWRQSDDQPFHLA